MKFGICGLKTYLIVHEFKVNLNEQIIIKQLKFIHYKQEIMNLILMSERDCKKLLPKYRK